MQNSRQSSRDGSRIILVGQNDARREDESAAIDCANPRRCRSKRDAKGPKHDSNERRPNPRHRGASAAACRPLCASAPVLSPPLCPPHVCMDHPSGMGAAFQQRAVAAVDVRGAATPHFPRVNAHRSHKKQVAVTADAFWGSANGLRVLRTHRIASRAASGGLPRPREHDRPHARTHPPMWASGSQLAHRG